MRGQGHSKNPSCNGFDGIGAVFAEVFAGGGDGKATLSDQVGDEIADCREGSGTGSDPAAILVHGHVADIVELVLDCPVSTIEREQAIGPGLPGWEACNQINDLDADLAADAARAFEPRDLGRTRPIEMGNDLGADGDFTRLDTAMSGVDRLGLAQIRRRTVVTAAWVRGGKDRRRPRRSRLSARTGCL